MHWCFDEPALRGALVRQVGLQPGQRLLDLGCGTGTLLLMLKGDCPHAACAGLDADPTMLRLARDKVGAAGFDIELREGMADAPPWPPASFDVIVSSLVFHHLPTPGKRRAFAAAFTLLAPGGQLHVMDWDAPHTPRMRVAAFGLRLFDGFATTADNVRGRLPAMMAAAGFVDVARTARRATLFGTLGRFRARKADG